MKRRDQLLILGICGLALLLSAGGFLPCLFRWAAGIPCPGCGMSRAYLALCSGDFRQAFFWHPLFWAPPIIAGLCLWKKGAAQSPKLWIPAGVLFFAVYLLRMALYFPDTPPMDYSPDNLLHTLTERIFL